MPNLVVTELDRAIAAEKLRIVTRAFPGLGRGRFAPGTPRAGNGQDRLPQAEPADRAYLFDPCNASQFMAAYAFLSGGPLMGASFGGPGYRDLRAGPLAAASALADGASCVYENVPFIDPGMLVAAAAALEIPFNVLADGEAVFPGADAPQAWPGPRVEWM